MPHNTSSRLTDPSSAALLNGPSPPDDETFGRWMEGHRRRRMMEGLWKTDLDDALPFETVEKTRKFIVEELRNRIVVLNKIAGEISKRQGDLIVDGSEGE